MLPDLSVPPAIFRGLGMVSTTALPTDRKKSIIRALQQEVSDVQLVEQHCISNRDPRYAIIDEAAFKSKNLYNAANVRRFGAC